MQGHAHRHIIMRRFTPARLALGSTAAFGAGLAYSFAPTPLLCAKGNGSYWNSKIAQPPPQPKKEPSLKLMYFDGAFDRSRMPSSSCAMLFSMMTHLARRRGGGVPGRCRTWADGAAAPAAGHRRQVP
eukprot:SAG11_NODE_17984_length_503_cov_0.881188_1_plen_127_part_10